MKKNYLLIDVLNLVFRVFHSTSKWQNIDTEEKQLANIDLFVHAILKSILGKRTLLGKNPEDLIQFENIILAFDSYSWRRDFLRNDESIEMSDEDYKAGRSKRSQAVIKLITNRLEEISHNIGLKVVKADKFEADDIIGLFPTLDNKYNPNNKYLVLSNDGDFGQLTKNPNVQVFNPNKDAFNKQDGTMALTIKTLIGDISDSIENPFFSLNLDNEPINIQYGEGTVLKGLNGKFTCQNTNNKKFTVKYHNGTLEIFEGEDDNKHTIYVSEKTKIEFDPDFNLNINQKLKFDKSVPSEELEEVTSNVNHIVKEIIMNTTEPFILDKNHREDFIENTVTLLVDKFEKEYLKWTKKNYTELSTKEHKEKSSEFWIKDLIVWNPKLVKNNELKTKKELIQYLCSIFHNNLDRNFTLIDFNKIPETLQKQFKEDIYPDILSPSNVAPEHRSQYLKQQQLFQISNLLAKEQILKTNIDVTNADIPF